jgi:hypothetical protein
MQEPPGYETQETLSQGDFRNHYTDQSRPLAENDTRFRHAPSLTWVLCQYSGPRRFLRQNRHPRHPRRRLHSHQRLAGVHFGAKSQVHQLLHLTDLGPIWASRLLTTAQSAPSPSPGLLYRLELLELRTLFVTTDRVLESSKHDCACWCWCRSR